MHIVKENWRVNYVAKHSHEKEMHDSKMLTHTGEKPF